MNIPLYIPVTYEAGIGNTLKGFISAFGISNDVKIVCNPHTLLGNYDTVFENELIGTTENRQHFSSCRFLVLKEEENIQMDLPNEYSKYNEIDLRDKSLWDLFSKKVMIDWYFDRTLICDKVFNRIQGHIEKLRWNSIILNEVNNFVQNMKFPALAISIRTWKANHPGDIGCKRPYDPNIYINVIKNVLENNSDIQNIFISYDNLKAEVNYRGFLQNYNTFVYNKPDYINPLQYDIINILILSKCQYYICNRHSTFGELVFWFSKCSQKVFTVY
jgi:hypothetical protein